jgi:hypothetical protein
MFATESTLALGLTEPPIKWVPGDLALGVNGKGVKLIIHLDLM